MIHYSSIQAYRDCPLYFRFTRIERLPEPPNKEANFGAALHSSLFVFAKASPTPPLQTLFGLFDGCWKSCLPAGQAGRRGNGCASEEEIEEYRALARDILTNFHESYHRNLRRPLAIGHRFNVTLAGVKVWGCMDWVEQTEGGALHIIDFKSGSNLPTRQPVCPGREVETDYQLTLYQMAAEKAWPLPVERLSLYHLRSGTLVSAGPRDSAHRQRVEEMVREVAEGIAAGAFEPKENFRCPCAFADRCPLFRHLCEGHAEAKTGYALHYRERS